VDQCRAEKHRVPSLELDLDHLLLEHLGKLRVVICQIAVFELLREGEELRRTRVERHVGVGNGELKSQELRSDLRSEREASDHVRTLETEICMWRLDLLENKCAAAHGNPDGAAELFLPA
jgi:hypothetical protein